jgi:hypothetical protein
MPVRVVTNPTRGMGWGGVGWDKVGKGACGVARVFHSCYARATRTCYTSCACICVGILRRLYLYCIDAVQHDMYGDVVELCVHVWCETCVRLRIVGGLIGYTDEVRWGYEILIFPVHYIIT